MLSHKKRNLIIILVAAGYNSIYSLASMKGLYYTLILNELHLTHFMLGQLYSAYGIFSMFSYLFGAFFLNHFSRWKLIASSSLIVGFLTGALALLPPYSIMLPIFGVSGFLIGAAFYPVHLEILHQLGGAENQGSVFSLFFVCNSLFGIVFSIIGFGITSLSFSDTAKTQFLFLLFAALNVAVSILSAIYLRQLPENDVVRSRIRLSSIKILLGNRQLWMIIVIVFINYLSFTNLNYILPYLSDTFHLPTQINNILSIIRVYCIGIVAAPVAGRITDRLHSASRVMGYTFLLHSITIFIMLIFTDGNVVFSILSLLAMCMFANMGKSMALITIDEANIPPAMYGMAISFISFCAYSPDAFYYSMSGWILDTFPTNGYDIIFFTAAITSLAGLLTVLKLNHRSSFLLKLRGFKNTTNHIQN